MAYWCRKDSPAASGGAGGHGFGQHPYRCTIGRGVDLGKLGSTKIIATFLENFLATTPSNRYLRPIRGVMVVVRGNPMTRGWLFGGTACVQEGVEKVNPKNEVR